MSDYKADVTSTSKLLLLRRQSSSFILNHPCGFSMDSAESPKAVKSEYDNTLNSSISSTFFFQFMCQPILKQIGLILFILGLTIAMVGIMGLVNGGALFTVLGFAGLLGVAIGGSTLACMGAAPWFFKANSSRLTSSEAIESMPLLEV